MFTAPVKMCFGSWVIKSWREKKNTFPPFKMDIKVHTWFEFGDRMVRKRRKIIVFSVRHFMNQKNCFLIAVNLIDIRIWTLVGIYKNIEKWNTHNWLRSYSKYIKFNRLAFVHDKKKKNVLSTSFVRTEKNQYRHRFVFIPCVYDRMNLIL